MENVYATDWDAIEDEPGYEWTRIRLGRRLGAGDGLQKFLDGTAEVPYFDEA